MELSILATKCTDNQKKEWREYHMMTLSTKVKSQGTLGAENVPGSAFVFQKHWTPLVSESRSLRLSPTWAGTGMLSHSPLRALEGPF